MAKAKSRAGGGKEPLRYHNGRPVWAEDSRGVPICGGKIVGSGKTCTNYKLMPNGRCVRHKGKTKNPEFEKHLLTGRYVRVLDGRAAEKFLQNLHDPELLSLRRDIAITDSRLEELVQDWHSLDGLTMKRLMKQAAGLSQALGEDVFVSDEVSLSAMKLIQTIEKLAAKKRIGDQIEQTQRHRKDLTVAENNQVNQSKQMIPVDKVYSIVLQLLSSISLHVNDPVTLRAIRDDARQVVVLPEDLNHVADAMEWQQTQKQLAAGEQVIEAEYTEG